MAYADYEFYKNNYYGDTLTSNNASKYLERASMEVDVLTWDRTVNYYPTDAESIRKVKMSVCAIADVLYNIDLFAKSVTPSVSSSGEIKGAVVSISSGRESISYGTSMQASAYARAVSDDAQKRLMIKNAGYKWLVNAVDSNNEYLIYAGVRGNVR